VHHDGVANPTLPREIHDELISDGRAKPHGAGFASVVSSHIREPEDVPGAVDLFRMNYERLRAREGRRGCCQSGRSANNDVGKREFLLYTQKM